MTASSSILKMKVLAKVVMEIEFMVLYSLEDTARYAGLLLAPAEGVGLWPTAFFALLAKKRPYAV